MIIKDEISQYFYNNFKQFHNIHKKTHVLNMYALRPTTLFKRCFPVNIGKFLKKSILKNLFLNPDLVILQIPVAFKPEPSLNLITPTLYFELRFPTLASRIIGGVGIIGQGVGHCNNY